MPRLPTAFFVLVLLVNSVWGASPALSQSAPAGRTVAELDLSAYEAELDYWSATLANSEALPEQALARARALPDAWRVRPEAHEYELSTQWLRDGLEAWRNKPGNRNTLRRYLQARLEALHQEARDFQNHRVPIDLAQTRNQLDDILHRREFAGIHSPTWWNRLQEMLSAWLLDLLARLAQRLGNYPLAGTLFVWLLIASAVSILALWLKRLWLRDAVALELHLEPDTLPEKDWRQLASKAAAAAARGDFRQAVCFTYWAGIYRLADLGVWTLDRARTPREYVRLLAPEDAKRSTLAVVTRRLEAVWYAGQPATASDFHEVVTHWEQMGCLLPLTPPTRKS